PSRLARRSVAGSQALQPAEVRPQRPAKGPLASVAQPVRAASLLDDAGERRVVQVTDPRKQMVLDLEVETAEIPGEEGVPGREVHGGGELVLGPVPLDAVRFEELGVLDAMGELEDCGEHVAENEHRETPEGEEPPGGVEPDRKSTRLNSSHLGISYAVFCLKKKT